MCGTHPHPANKPKKGPLRFPGRPPPSMRNGNASLLPYTCILPFEESLTVECCEWAQAVRGRNSTVLNRGVQPESGRSLPKSAIPPAMKTRYVSRISRLLENRLAPPPRAEMGVVHADRHATLLQRRIIPEPVAPYFLSDFVAVQARPPIGWAAADMGCIVRPQRRLLRTWRRNLVGQTLLHPSSFGFGGSAGGVGFDQLPFIPPYGPSKPLLTIWVC